MVKDFEERLNAKKNERKSTSSKFESKVKKAKQINMQESDEDYHTDENQSITTENDADSTKNDNNGDDDRVVTRHSPRKQVSLPKSTSGQSPSPRRHSSRRIVKETKSRITTMCKFIFNLPKKKKITKISFKLKMKVQMMKMIILLYKNYHQERKF